MRSDTGTWLGLAGLVLLRGGGLIALLVVPAATAARVQVWAAVGGASVPVGPPLKWARDSVLLPIAEVRSERVMTVVRQRPGRASSSVPD